ncbi:ABC transporter permease subunit, partial [Calidithermus terrae]
SIPRSLYEAAAIDGAGEWRMFWRITLPLLLDGVSPGSGQGYPPEWLEPLRHHPRLIVAGGLTPENLGPVLALRPYAVDVSSGVEEAVGLKSPDKLRAFLEAVDNSRSIVEACG